MKLENIFVKEEFLRQVNLTILHGKFYFITGDETSNKLLSTIGLKEEIVLGNYYIGDINIAKLPNRKITLIRRKYFVKKGITNPANTLPKSKSGLLGQRLTKNINSAIGIGKIV